MKLNFRTIAAMLLAAVSLESAALTLPDIINRNMVLQQNSEASLWGWAKPQSKVTVTTGWNGRSYTATAGKDGRWNVKVATPAASYDVQNVTVTGDGTTVDLDNVLIGEVWFASGIGRAHV